MITQRSRRAPAEPLSARVLRYRIARGYSAGDLASAAGVWAGAIRGLESGRPVDKRMLAPLAAALGVPLCRLVCGEHSCAQQACAPASRLDAREPPRRSGAFLLLTTPPRRRARRQTSRRASFRIAAICEILESIAARQQRVALAAPASEAPHLDVDAAMLILDEHFAAGNSPARCTRADVEAAFAWLTHPRVRRARWTDPQHQSIVVTTALLLTLSSQSVPAESRLDAQELRELDIMLGRFHCDRFAQKGTGTTERHVP
jgi:transcriptional regulator with XRE-family HTH domain